MMYDNLYALWCSWDRQNPAEWAALVMESCPIEERETKTQSGTEESRDGVSADV